jgi:CelD/BcsL family acetyltransferase involved in cellulose biosynthesis
MSGALAAEAIEDDEAFAALAPDWWELWRRAQEATPFQSPAWLLPWWRHFHPGVLLAIAVRAEGRLVGLAPFYLEDGPYGRRLLPVGISLSDYLDVLLDPDCAEAVGGAIVARMMQERVRWDSWELEELGGGAAALRLPVPDGCEENVTEQTACPVLRLPKDATDLAACVPKKKRRQIALARNRLARHENVVIERADEASALIVLDALFELHGTRWQARGEAGLLVDAVVRRFQRDAVPGLKAAGLLRLHVLRIDGRAVAVHYGLRHGIRAYVYLSGFDPAHAFESPSVVLLAHAIEEALTEGAREVHFLRGREPYKYGWGAEDRWNLRRSFRRRRADAV